MKINRPARLLLLGMACLFLTFCLGACSGAGDSGSAVPAASAGPVDTRATTLPGSVIPSVGGAGNGGGVSGGGAGVGSSGGAR